MASTFSCVRICRICAQRCHLPPSRPRLLLSSSPVIPSLGRRGLHRTTPRRADDRTSNPEDKDDSESSAPSQTSQQSTPSVAQPPPPPSSSEPLPSSINTPPTLPPDSSSSSASSTQNASFTDSTSEIVPPSGQSDPAVKDPSEESVSASPETQTQPQSQPQPQPQRKYTREQQLAIDAGNKAIPEKELLRQAVIRSDAMRLDYFDDLATIRSGVDKITHIQPGDEQETTEEVPDEELQDQITGWWRGLSESVQEDNDPLNPGGVVAIFEGEKLEEASEDSPYGVKWESARKAFERITVERGSAQSSAYLQLPRIPDAIMEEQGRQSRMSQFEGDSGEQMRTVARQTGLDASQLAQLRIRQVVENRVANQTNLGKIRSSYTMMIVGDRNGMLGIGEGKSTDGGEARQQALTQAIRTMRPILRYENRTIYGDVKAKVGATELELRSASPGYGIRCSERIYEMCECAGITDLAARVTRARNPMNTVKAAYKALTSQRDPEEVARARGRKMVDVRKVYYGGFT